MILQSQDSGDSKGDLGLAATGLEGGVGLDDELVGLELVEQGQEGEGGSG
jgi:hypothetical protein